VVGEMHGSVAGGIGAYVDSARLDQRYAAVYLGVIGCALLSVLLKAALDVTAVFVHAFVKSLMLGTRMRLRAVWSELRYES
jgi:ABC-type nitrate/sulfonate/bicarbonate transport system permease component